MSLKLKKLGWCEPEEQGSLCANAADKKSRAGFEFEWKAQEGEEKAITPSLRNQCTGVHPPVAG